MKIRAYAKINLTLDVCGRRADGYHLLDSVMQSVSLHDTVTMECDDKITVTCSLPQLSGENNTAAVAARRFFALTGIVSGARIFIEKRIPSPGGLGGGSADAAAVLYGLDRMYGTRLSSRELSDLALSVGADVPFCLTGGTARVGGIGEDILPLPPLPECCFLLVESGEKPSTAEMYRRLDEGRVCHPDTAGAVNAVRSGSLSALGSCAGNSFAAVCDITKIKRLLAETAPLGLSLSGSGPVAYALYETAGQAALAGRLLASEKIGFLTAAPCRQGVEVINED